MKKRKIVLIDYGLGNLFNVVNAFDKIGETIQVSNNSDGIKNFDAIIIPGVGSFGDAMARLSENGLADSIARSSARGVPILGICLGMQLLFERSFEFGEHVGLRLMKGNVEKLDSICGSETFKVPQVGWNKVYAREPNLFHHKKVSKGMHNSSFYFVHSFAVSQKSLPGEVKSFATTVYEGAEFVSAVEKDNLLGVQFHPERSGVVGLEFLRNWSSSINQF